VVSPSTGRALSAVTSIPALAGPDNAVAANRKEDAVDAVLARAERRSDTKISSSLSLHVEWSDEDEASLDETMDGVAEKARVLAHRHVAAIVIARRLECVIMVEM